MGIKTSTAMSGFVASTPQLSHSETGEARMYMRVGQEHYIRHEDGTFSQSQSTFTDLVMFRKSAERAAKQFQKGDRFIAEGHINIHNQIDENGNTVQQEEFIARKIGHNTALTNYQIERTPRIEQNHTNNPNLTQTQTQTPTPAQAQPPVPAPVQALPPTPAAAQTRTVRQTPASFQPRGLAVASPVVEPLTVRM